MSVDFYYKVPPCDKCGQSNGAGEVELNLTYNLCKMWHECNERKKEKLVEIEGMSGAQAIEKVESRLKELIGRSEHYKQFNPQNGWGSYDNLVSVLSEIIRVSRQFPDGIWECWR